MGDTTEFWVTPEEKAAGALVPDKLAQIVQKYEEDGLCVLCNVIDHAVLDRSALDQWHPSRCRAPSPAPLSEAHPCRVAITA